MVRLALIVVVGLQMWAQSKGPVTFTVRDVQGRPIQGAYIDGGAGAPPWGPQSDQVGRVVATISGQSVVVRSRGFVSERVRVEGSEVAVVLRSTDRRVPECPKVVTCDFSLCFAEIDGIQRLPIVSDVDYSQRFYTVVPDPKDRSAVLSHGQGANWSRGLPSLGLVEDSIRFQEDVMPWGEFWIVDSRGTSRDKREWRFIGRFGETVDYVGLEPALAARYDKMLDSICLRNQAPR